MKTSFDATFYEQFFVLLNIFFTCTTTSDARANNKDVGSASAVKQNEKNTCETRGTCTTGDSNVPPAVTAHSLRVRNCMCDEKCSLYDDCCEDSAFHYSSAHPSSRFTCVSTSVDGDVYMVTSCPAMLNESSPAVKYCHLSEDVLSETTDPLLRVPVTTTASLITYRNVFCAACHNESDFVFWNVLMSYEKLEELVIPQVWESAASSSNYTVENVTNASESYATVADASTILSTMKFENGSWKLPLNGDGTWKNVHAYEIVPRNLSQRIRHCVPRVIDSCPAGWSDSRVLALCANSTSYVQVNGSVFKNTHCAECHDFALDASTSCRNVTGTSDFVPPESLDALTVSIDDERLQELKESCDAVDAVSPAYELVCSSFQMETTTEAISNKVPQKRAPKKYIGTCFPKNTRYKPPRVCLVHKVTNKRDPDVVIENSTSLTFLGTRYANGKDAFWNETNESVVICGTFITPSSPILYQIEEILTSVLIKVSIVCLLLHLLFVQQLKELRNLSGKNLACFSLTLLTFYISYNFGPAIRTWFGSCAHTSILSHYCLLSCFVWMFVMSYDCWLSLYRATSQFRTSGGKHATKFALYCAISWGCPVFVLGFSLYLEFYMPRTFESCEKLPVPGYGLTESCWMLHESAKLYLFFIPSSAMIAGNVCFFAHTVYMIYGNKKNSVNPNTQNDFRIYARLALLMGLTWTLGILNNLTDGIWSDIVGVVYDILNMAQGALIFFGFTCKEKTFKLLLTKYKGNRFVSSILLKFLPRTKQELAMADMKSNSTDTTI